MSSSPAQPSYDVSVISNPNLEPSQGSVTEESMSFQFVDDVQPSIGKENKETKEKKAAKDRTLSHQGKLEDRQRFPTVFTYGRTSEETANTTHTGKVNVSQTYVSDDSYAYLSDSVGRKTSKIEDILTLKYTGPEEEKGLDGSEIVETTTHKDIEQPHVLVKSRKTPKKVIFGKLLMIFAYYVDMAAIYWTASTLIPLEEYWYFGALVVFILAFLIQNTRSNFKDIANPYKAFFLSISHLDYIYLHFFYSKKDINLRRKTLLEIIDHNPLCAREFYKTLFGTFPVSFVSVHLLFAANHTTVIVQTTVNVTIIYACLALMHVIISYDKTLKKINLKKIYLLLGIGSHACFEMSGLMFVWGFYATLTGLYGALLFFPFSLILWYIICGMLEGTSKKSMEYLYYTSFSPIATTYKVGFFLRVVQFISFIIIFAIKRDQLVILLSDRLFFWYFITGWSCVLLWLLNSLYFYSSLKTTKDDTESVLMSVRQSVMIRSIARHSAVRNSAVRHSLSEKLLGAKPNRSSNMSSTYGEPEYQKR